MKMPPNWQLN